MKYIRTKDEIKEYSDTCDLSYVYQSVGGIKVADTIEELCDRYYGVDENGEVVIVYNWSKDSVPIRPHEWAIDGFCTRENITISELKNRFPRGIFGAVVWFDDKNNLHIDIVAKMNNKGELELL